LIWQRQGRTKSWYDHWGLQQYLKSTSFRVMPVYAV